MAENQEKTCFIIMPITTPDPMLQTYRDGAEHFTHVLECLFVPAVKRADYLPIRPKAQGSDLIHAEIVRSIETSELVLCDMSCLNPNVFFEFGIRTSLNRPVCVVKDDLTKSVPFDTGVLNHHQYASTLEPWELEAEIAKLAEHLKTSAERSKGGNALWRYFGMKTQATANQGEGGADAKLDYLVTSLERIGRSVEAMSEAKLPLSETESMNSRMTHVAEMVHSMLPNDSYSGFEYAGRDHYIVHLLSDLPLEVKRRVRGRIRRLFGITIGFSTPVSPNRSDVMGNP